MSKQIGSVLVSASDGAKKVIGQGKKQRMKESKGKESRESGTKKTHSMKVTSAVPGSMSASGSKKETAL